MSNMDFIDFILDPNTTWNKNTRKKLLELITTDRNYDVRCRVADDPNTPPKILEILMADEDPDVRYCVANNPNTPPKALKILATDRDFDVRCSVANNPNTPHYIKRFIKIQEQLAKLDKK